MTVHGGPANGSFRRGQGAGRGGDLLAITVALLAVAMGGFMVLALTATTAGLVLALVAAGLATVGIGLTLRVMLANTDATSTLRATRRSAVGLAALAAATLAVAVVAADEDAASHSTRAADAGGAAQTLRAFLGAAVLEDNAAAACNYLTASEQQRVAGLAGQGQTCRDALTGTPPVLHGVTSEGRLHALHLRTTLRRGRALITVSGSRTGPVTFALRPATPAELEAFAAPSARWRVASGATALLGAR